MNKTSNRKLIAIFLASLVSLISLFTIGCEIEADEASTGKIFVELRDTGGAELTGGRIWLDGVQTSQVTPDTLRQIGEGTHLIKVIKPGFLEAAMDVSVVADQVAFASLIAETAPPAAIELVDALDGTVLLINNSPFGVTPPTVFGGIGSGTWNVSAYLDGFATAAPARWTVTLVEGDTARINAQFVPLTVGPAPGMLAPVFDLPSDVDSSMHYRLQDYRGGITLVSFFFYNCAPCYAEFPHIQSVYSDPANAGVFQVLAVDANDPWFFFSTYREDHSELGLTFPLLFDMTQHSRTQLYQFSTCPSNYVIDPTGMIRFAWGTLTEEQLRGAVDALKTEFNLTGQN
jgi:peroxiredoxin